MYEGFDTRFYDLEDLLADLQYLKDSVSKISKYLRETYEFEITRKDVFTAKKVRITLNDKNSGCNYSPDFNLITIGTKYVRTYSVAMIRSDLVHEFLHAMGLRHDNYSRKIGYYSQVKKDTLSGEVMVVIGWDKPTTEDYEYCSSMVNNIIREERKSYVEQSKYIILCNNCDFKTYRKRMSRVIKLIDKCSCPVCKGYTLRVDKNE